MVKSVREIKILIKECMIHEYEFKTNFSCEDFLVEIGNGLIIKAVPLIENNKVIYKFMLDTQFLSAKEITYDEICMIKRVIDVLEDNRKFALSKFKKYSVDEFLEEKRLREEESERMLEAFEQAIIKMYAHNNGVEL